MKNLLFALIFLATPLMAQKPITIRLEKDLDAIGNSAAAIVLEEITKAEREQKQLTFILPTGSTPESMYSTLVKWFYEGSLDFSKVVFFNLDEYVGLGHEDKNSYAHYMRHHLYNFITPGITREKLQLFGLKSLTKADCFNKRNRTRLNASIDCFCNAIIECTKENPNTLEAFENCVQTLKKDNRDFLKLYTEHMDDHALPSFNSLKAWIEKDISLRSLAANEKNIHLIDGLANADEEIYSYRKKLRHYLTNTNGTTVCFAGIGRKPAHVAFNEFITETPFLDEKLSTKEKNKKALKSQMRLVALADGTKQSNARFFSDNVSSVPSHALTLGLSEILDCTRIVLLAGGSEKKEALYEVFSSDACYKSSASLLTKFHKDQLMFILDEKAYGLAEEKSLFALSILNANKKNTQRIELITHESTKLPFWHIPSSKAPTLLDKGYKLEHKSITMVSIPEKQTVLWAKKDRIHYSLWQELKDKKNKVHVVQKYDIDSLLTQIDKHKPDIIILPFVHSVIEDFSKLKSEISSRYPNKPILGIFYETSESLNNVFLPLSKEEQKNKVEVIHKFHHTQVSRGRFDLIAGEMSTVYSPLSLYNETFTFFNLKSEDQQIKLIPFTEKLFISKSYEKNKKHKKYPSFSFDANDAVTIIAPHPDDAEIGAAALISHLGKEKIKTRVLNATSGYRSQIKKEFVLSHPYLPEDIMQQAKCEISEFIESQALKSRIRECESLGALSYLNPDIEIQNLRLPFYSHVNSKFTQEDRKEIDLAIQRCTKGSKRFVFFLPYPQDSQSTHRQVYQIFMERISSFYKKNPGSDVIIAFYPTPWTGQWNMYDYSYNQGSKLAALSGAELLVGNGKSAAKPETLGGIYAKRYQVFYFNN